MATHTVKAYSAAAPGAPLQPTTVSRRAPCAGDVQIEVMYCGVCHSDIHTARNEWSDMGAPTAFPCVPGHEIVGRVTAVGSGVSKFKIGDIAAVGCLVDSDKTCKQCKCGREQNCPNGVYTYNGKDKHLGGHTFGGYSESVVVDQDFVLRVPAELHSNLAGTAPLLCAGITTYSPLRHWNVKSGSVVGVVGLGGLGHMAVKLAVAMGAKVTVFTRSASRDKDARRIGASDVVISTNAEEMKKRAGVFDFIIDTIAAEHDINAYLMLLAPEGTVCLVGAPAKPLPVASFALIMGRHGLSGSNIGGIAETQEMLDFCAKHGIFADVEIIPIQKINEAYDRVVASDVKFRFSIDMASLKK